MTQNQRFVLKALVEMVMSFIAAIEACLLFSGLFLMAFGTVNMFIHAGSQDWRMNVFNACLCLGGALVSIIGSVFFSITMTIERIVMHLLGDTQSTKR